MQLDRTGQAILRELQRDGWLSNRELADRVDLSESDFERLHIQHLPRLPARS
jgi:DNA-binding Lrp family transcriptional regulator